MIGQSPFNESYNDPKYVGYRYDNNGVVTDSNLKITLDTWYTSNMSSVDSKVETSTYCNDTTTFGDEDYSVFTVTVKGDEIGEYERLAADEIIMYGTLYHIYSGNTVDHIQVDYVKSGSGEVIETADSGSLEEAY